MTDQLCKIWGTVAQVSQDESGRFHINSDRAGGRYMTFGSAAELVSQLSDIQKTQLTLSIAETNVYGETFVIDDTALERISSARFPAPEIRAENLLRHIVSEYPMLGMKPAYKSLPDADIPSWFVWSVSSTRGEITYLVEYLARLDWLKISRDNSGAVNWFQIEPEGFASLAGQGNTHSKQAFVAMWFDKSMNEVYEGGIGKAIEDAGYIPMIIRQKEFNNYVDDEIISEIRKSKFVVADFTSMSGQPRGGVYFEAGFAKGLGLEVIWTCRADQIKKVHFDTRQFNHIVWKDVEDLHRQLKVRIGATIGWGPHK